ncbi:FAD-binding oxidoreductase [Donghicola sp. C2-DW-16]|uniref:FAD-binding oxidoreductase n=1 Tax=Donghicola mangrovi TaxID=2729614 RepID=A0ABX2P9G1_9RHOB|nr:FAD-binding oxidoreductase [Donghicola mangrovi]NVO26081.1 FAD-binding oxidoreductase [Donghicola mangrovi]
MAMAEMTVYGAGAFGLAIAWECVRRGAKVRVIDPFGPGAGSSGGVVGALAPHTPENWNAKKDFQFRSLLAAAEFWAGVEEAGGKSAGYARSGRLQPIADERALDLARAREVSAATLWEGQAEWRVIPEGDAAGWAPRSATGFLIHDTLSGRMHPRQACEALVAAITAKGGEVVTEGPEEGAVVHATGWWGLKDLSERFGKTVGNGVKGQAAVFALDRREMPQLYADSLHIIPHANGTVAIGSTSEREFDAPDTVDQQLDDVIARARQALPELEGAEVIQRWAGVRPRAKSRAPMLGALPDAAGQFVANGGFKIGFGMAAGVARVMADLVLEGRDGIPAGFRVEDNL